MDENSSTEGQSVTDEVEKNSSLDDGDTEEQMQSAVDGPSFSASSSVTTVEISEENLANAIQEMIAELSLPFDVVVEGTPTVELIDKAYQALVDKNKMQSEVIDSMQMQLEDNERRISELNELPLQLQEQFSSCSSLLKAISKPPTCLSKNMTNLRAEGASNLKVLHYFEHQFDMARQLEEIIGQQQPWLNELTKMIASAEEQKEKKIKQRG